MLLCGKQARCVPDEAVVIVDPVQYQRRRDERDDVSMLLRTLHFGPHDDGLVTFLVYPHDLVLVADLLSDHDQRSLAKHARFPPIGSAASDNPGMHHSDSDRSPAGTDVAAPRRKRL